MSSGDADPSSKNEPGVFSLDDIDKIIEQEDPNFKTQVEAIRSDSIGDESLEASNIVTDDDELGGKDDEEQPARRRILALLTKPLVKLKDWFRRKWVNLKVRTILLIDISKNFIRHEFPERLRYYRSRVSAGHAWILAEWGRFKQLPLSQKGGLIGIVLISWAALFLFVKSFSSDFLPRLSDPLPRSLETKAEFVGHFRESGELQELFAAFPEVEYHVLLDKVVVNLTPDERSGPKPMGAFQFYFGVDAQDTAIEVKQRERELLDLTQRTLETFTYSDVMSQAGKIRIKSAIRDRVNEVLNQGRVMHLYFNIVMSYP